MRFKSTVVNAIFLSVFPLCAFAAETAQKGEDNAEKPAASIATSSRPALASDNPSFPARKIRIAYVDLARIGNESEMGKEFKREIKEKQEKLQQQIEKRKKELERQKKAIEAKLPALTTAEREAKGREFQKKVEEFQKFAMNTEKGLLNFQEELSRSMFAEVEKVSAEYGRSKGFAVVMVKQELLYVSGDVDAIDITQDVNLTMNAGVKKQ